jgi:hypothetical protein
VKHPYAKEKKKTNNLFHFLEMNFCFLISILKPISKKKEMKEKLKKRKKRNAKEKEKKKNLD